MALAVVAIALGALLGSAGAQTRGAAALQERVFAHWVAMNQAAELQLQPSPPPVGSSQGQAAMGGRDWRWRIQIEATADPNVDRVRIEVRADNDDTQPITTLISFLYRNGGAP